MRLFLQKILAIFKEKIILGNRHYEEVSNSLLPSWYKTWKKVYHPVLNKAAGFTFLVYILNSMYSLFQGYNTFIIILCSSGILYLWVFYIIDGYYLIPHWRKFLVKNSPTEWLASTVALSKLLKGKPFVILAALGGSLMGFNEVHKQVFPDTKPPAEILGETISRYTGYPPKSWKK